MKRRQRVSLPIFLVMRLENRKQKFIDSWLHNKNGRKFAEVFEYLAKEHAKEVETDEMIRFTKDARINVRFLLFPLVYLCALYENAWFNAQAKYVMLRKAASEDKKLSYFLLI